MCLICIVKCHWAKQALVIWLLAIAISAVLFSDYLVSSGPGCLQAFVCGIAAPCHDPAMQWMIVLCLASYLTMFLVLEHRLTRAPAFHLPYSIANSANFWLSAFITPALLRYALTYGTASQSTQVPVVLAGIVFGKAICAWTAGGLTIRDSTAFSTVEAERDRAQRMREMIFILLMLLAGAASWQPAAAVKAQYHGISRWSGSWSNPNLYGLLMGTGIVLAVGLVIVYLKQSKSRNVKVALGIIAASVMSLGLRGLSKQSGRKRCLHKSFDYN